MPKISIIIPVYNVEKYLKKCLDSCIAQTFKDIEVIVVNDCSPDNSDKIMKEYELKYPDLVKCIYLEENIKLGGARNRGLEIAQGKYIMFVDSDDYIASNMCEKLYNSIISNDADIAMCDYCRIINDKQIYTPAFSPIIDSQNNISQQLLLSNFVQISATAKLCKKELLGECLFPEHSYYEDLATVLIWLFKAEKINYLAEPLYLYICRNNSITNVYEYSNKIQEINAIIKLIENLKTSGLFDINNFDIIGYIFNQVYRIILKYICYFLRHSQKDINLFCEYVKENIPNYEEIINNHSLLMKNEKHFFINFLRDSIFLDDLYKKIKKYFCTKQNIAIWGTGAWGKNIYSFINQFDVKPVCFIDSNINQQGKNIDGIEIVPFEKLKDNCDMIIVAIKDENAFKEIKELVMQTSRNIEVIHYTELYKID